MTARHGRAEKLLRTRDGVGFAEVEIEFVLCLFACACGRGGEVEGTHWLLLLVVAVHLRETEVQILFG